MAQNLQRDTSPANIRLQVCVYNQVDGGTTEQQFDDFPIRIGRDKLNDLVLSHPYVSQWHAVIGYVQGALSLVQVGGTNSARVGGHKLSSNDAIALRGDETIEILPFTLQIRAGRRPGNDAENPQAEHSLIRGAAQAENNTDARAGVALQVLDRLSRTYLGKSFESPQEVAAFGARLEEALDVFLRCLVALKKGQDQFRATLDMRALATREHDAVDRAETATELGIALFSQAHGAAASLERAFKDIMIHQVALLNGLMAGVRALLNKLSPRAVQKEATKQTRAPGFKALWQTFERLHRDLTEEEAATFEEIFGRQFDRAYTQVASRNHDS